MKIFVTSNLQLGRPSAINRFDRPFKDVQEMNNVLIKNWNEHVSPGDIVYHLGNFAWDPKIAQDALSNLNGKIYLMPAENDDAIMHLHSKGQLPSNAGMMNRIMPLKSAECTMSYWPMSAWPHFEEGYYSIIGYPDHNFKSDPERKIINVCSDLWNFKPQELERLISTFKDF